MSVLLLPSGAFRALDPSKLLFKILLSGKIIITGASKLLNSANTA